MQKIYDLILDFNHNVEPAVLTFGPLLFDFVDKKKWTFNYDKFRNKAKTYYLYSERNICLTFKWLEENGFIYYSKKYNNYYVTDMLKDVINEYDNKEKEISLNDI